MAQPNALELAYFQEQLAFAQKMAGVLRSSFERATPIVQLFETDSNAQISLEQAEILEALTARFARLTDTVTQWH
jgi:hypothetical protein